MSKCNSSLRFTKLTLNPGHAISGTNVKGQATGDQPNQLRTTSQQVNLNINAARNAIKIKVKLKMTAKAQTHHHLVSFEASSFFG